MPCNSDFESSCLKKWLLCQLILKLFSSTCIATLSHNLVDKWKFKLNCGRLEWHHPQKHGKFMLFYWHYVIHFEAVKEQLKCMQHTHSGESECVPKLARCML
uniref:Uncharacterized protein n=1 Tax=Rhipicephalus microplus TaxID=6941 RepID=A0A6G5A366_RHIMP